MDTSQNIKILEEFTIDTIPDLDVAVLGALELFQKEKLPEIKLGKYNRPLVVGSGNAEATGRIIFKDSDAIFASESSFAQKLEKIKNIDAVILVSASGSKHAPIIAKKAKEHGKHTTLITTTQNSPASQVFGEKDDFTQYIFPKNREPYTYNTSTYMGMILGYTKEDPKAICEFIKKQVDIEKLVDLSKYHKFYLIVPSEFSGIIRMLHVKFIELFGRNIARDIETAEYVKHATTVAPAKELFVSFGEKNDIWGKPQDRIHIPLPQKANYAAMMAIGYYFVAQIQKSHSPYFKENIVDYTKKISKIFDHAISPIVE